MSVQEFLLTCNFPYLACIGSGEIPSRGSSTMDMRQLLPTYSYKWSRLKLFYLVGIVSQELNCSDILQCHFVAKKRHLAEPQFTEPVYQDSSSSDLPIF